MVYTDPQQVDAIAAIIRQVDGAHRLGAAALAEALVARGVTVTAAPLPAPAKPARRGDGPCYMDFPHAEHRWDTEDLTVLRYQCPGVV